MFRIRIEHLLHLGGIGTIQGLRCGLLGQAVGFMYDDDIPLRPLYARVFGSGFMLERVLQGP